MKKNEIKKLSDIKLTKEIKKMKLSADSPEKEWTKLGLLFRELSKRRKL